ncbi:MAG: hypothetical protein JW857_02130 [Bacteroidales bacterium]|nr:hypothetical protein [Bacteroidales bacterium]
MGEFSRRFSAMFKSQRKVWNELAYDLKAEFVDKGFFKPLEVVKKEEGYEIKLDSFTKMAGRTPIITTRFESNCDAVEDFRFLIKRKNIFNKRAPKGLELIPVEYHEFDHLFRLFASNKRRIHRVFNRKLQSQLVNQAPYRDIRIELKANILELQIKPLIKDIEQLKSLFVLMESIQEQLRADS